MEKNMFIDFLIKTVLRGIIIQLEFCAIAKYSENFLNLYHKAGLYMTNGEPREKSHKKVCNRNHKV